MPENNQKKSHPSLWPAVDGMQSPVSIIAAGTPTPMIFSPASFNLTSPEKA